MEYGKGILALSYTSETGSVCYNRCTQDKVSLSGAIAIIAISRLVDFLHPVCMPKLISTIPQPLQRGYSSRTTEIEPQHERMMDFNRRILILASFLIVAVAVPQVAAANTSPGIRRVSANLPI